MGALAGHEAVRLLDMEVAEARKALERAIGASEEAEAERAVLRQEVARRYGEIAKLRLDVVIKGEARLSEAERQAAELVEAHRQLVEGLLAEMEALRERMEQLEDMRTNHAVELEQALEAYDAGVSEVEEKLLHDPAYQDLAAKAEEADAIVGRAEQKLTLSLQDRTEKGEPYEEDDLFTYLWDRGFGTPAYGGKGLARMVDGWIAKATGYEGARLNYQRLLELPDRLEEHLERCRAGAARAEEALDQYEAAALSRAGVDAVLERVERARAEIDAADAELAELEARHLELAEERQRAAEGQTGPAQEARRILAGRLQRTGIPDLRVLVAETVTTEDDEALDALVSLRRREMELDLEADGLAHVPASRRRELARLESLRRAMKASRLDSPYLLIERARLDDAVASVVSGEIEASTAARRLFKRAKRRQSRSTYGFGGSRHRGTYGLPEIAGQVGAIVLTEALRAGMGSHRRKGGFGGFGGLGGGFGGGLGGGGGKGGSGGGFRTGGGF